MPESIAGSAETGVLADPAPPPAADAPPPVVTLEGVSKRYGLRLALDRVSLEVEAGEVLGLLGPNGSGKTTTLRILTGYLHPSAGRAVVAGHDVVDEGLEARRHIGYVPEDPPLYPGMRVDEFLGFMAKVRGMRAFEARAAVDAASERLSLGPVRRLVIRKLSRGYRQRVAIAQALLHDPPLLILDEPTNGLDPRQIIEVRELVAALRERHTILVSSHILSEIERVASRVAILLDGKLLGVKALAGGERLRLRIRGAPREAVAAVLAAVPGVVGRAAPGESVDGVAEYVVAVERADVAEPLAAAVAAAGFGLLEMTGAAGDLERLFLDLTGRAA